MRPATSMLLVAGALAAAGCGGGGPLTCDRTEEGNPVVNYSEGTAVDGVYMSSPWEGELLHFPGGMHYALEHKLGKAPRWVTAYLSFDRDGTKSSGLAPAAGNQVMILDVNEATVKVANDSCVDYWLLVSAGSGPVAAPP